MLDVTASTLIFQVSGQNAKEVFKNESGGHRFQRTPPNERSGRVHTSTITVAVLNVPEEKEFRVNAGDITIEAMRGSGKGGQAKQKTSSCIVATHKSGIRVRIESSRSQYENRVLAIGMIESKLQQSVAAGHAADINDIRRNMCGDGLRGSWRRSCRIQHGIVDDKITGQSWSWKDYESGRWK